MEESIFFFEGWIMFDEFNDVLADLLEGFESVLW